MENIQLKPTQNTPKIDFLTNGNLMITGSLYAENAKDFFAPLHAWVANLHIKEVNVELRIEYLNSACSKEIFRLLQRLKQNEKIETIHIKWYYQKGDEDARETGELISNALTSVDFELIEYDKGNS
jgi:hypothetical protein